MTWIQSWGPTWLEERTDSNWFGPPHMSGHSFTSRHRITHVSSRQTSLCFWHFLDIFLLNSFKILDTEVCYLAVGVGCPGAGCHGAQAVLGSWWSPCLSLPSTGISLTQYLNSFWRWLFSVARVETVPPGGRQSWWSAASSWRRIFMDHKTFKAE